MSANANLRGYAQVRSLASADAGTARAIWDKSVELAQQRGSKVTASLVQETISRTLHQHSLPIHLSSSTQQWHTPPAFLKLVRAVFDGGLVDLDPCSDQIAQARVKARAIFTAQDVGLCQEWHGRVFVNPPFGAEGGHSQQGAYFEKALTEYRAGHAAEILLLLKAAIGYAWFAPVLHWPHAWLHARVAFIAGEQHSTTQNPHGSIAVYLGPNTERFCQVFSEFASIPGRNSWGMSDM